MDQILESSMGDSVRHVYHLCAWSVFTVCETDPNLCENMVREREVFTVLKSWTISVVYH